MRDINRLTVRLLGSFQASLDGKPVTLFESDKVQALLAYLMVESAEVHRRDKLAGLLWADMPEQRARSNLSQALYNLRHLLNDPVNPEPFLLPTRETIQFNPHSDHWLDVTAFDHLLKEQRRHNHGPSELCGECLESLQQAVALYRGDFLEGLSFAQNLAIEEWCLVGRTRYSRQELEALFSLANYYQQRGETENALEYAWRQVDLDPLNEAAQRQLMGLLAASEQRSQALTQFKRLQALLTEELDVQPEQETIELYERLRAAPALQATQDTRRHNLPVPLTPFIGRQAELEEVQGCFKGADCRLLTILGPGGSGKTRLALEVARENLPHTQHGVFFVGLNPLQSSQAIVPAIIEAIDYPTQEKSEVQAQLNNYLQNKDLLLVMDGFEHLIDGAGLLADILHAAPRVKVLVTSRARLNIKGEQIYNLSGLRYPEQESEDKAVLESEAVQLFLDGAQRVRPDYKPQPGELGQIIKVCRQVEGMPLGLLLASSWLASMELEEIAAEIERGLDFLSSDWADVPTRQRSLRATFDHSWDLLSPRERVIFKNLSIFRGGFSRQAARIVADASPHELHALVNKSLLVRKSPGRYDMHELLRQYSADKQAESVEDDLSAHERHAIYFCKALVSWGEQLKSPGQADALEEMDIELENIRAAWNWAAGQHILPLLAGMVETVCLYYDLRARYAEGESACREACDNLNAIPTGEELRIRAQLIIWQGHFNRVLGKQERAQSQYTQCQLLLDQTKISLMDIRFEQALLGFEFGEAVKESDFSQAREHFLNSLALFQELEQPWWAAKALLNKAVCDLQIGDFKAALPDLDQCITILQTGGDRRNLAKALRWKGFLHVRRGELDQGMQSMQGAIAVYRLVGDQANIADSLSGLGLILGWHGRFLEALDQCNQSLSIYQELGDHYNSVFMTLIISMALTNMGRYPEAEKHARTVFEQASKFDFKRIVATSQLVMGWVALSTGNVHRAKDVLQGSVDCYRKVNHQDELGWALSALGHSNLALGETNAGLACIREALQIGGEIGAAMTIGHAIGPSAVWIGNQGNRIRAVELYNLACQNPALMNSSWFEDIYGCKISKFAGQIPDETFAAAQQRGRALDLWETACQLHDELG